MTDDERIAADPNHAHDWFGFPGLRSCYYCGIDEPYSGVGPDLAIGLARRVLDVLAGDAFTAAHHLVDREQVARDAAGLTQHSRADWYDDLLDDAPRPDVCDYCTFDVREVPWPCPDAWRYTKSIAARAFLYGVKP